LDFDSEGLLILTDDNRLKKRLLEPENKVLKTYLAQVERIPTEAALRQLEQGIVIEGRRTLPAHAMLLQNEPILPLRSIPIRFRKNVPTAWLELTITEGRNRQVRKMTAAVGFPTLRLIRIRIASLTLEGLEPGMFRKLTPPEIRELEKLQKKWSGETSEKLIVSHQIPR
jgi:23S rRNA pseudouridine2457 synthase